MEVLMSLNKIILIIFISTGCAQKSLDHDKIVSNDFDRSILNSKVSDILFLYSSTGINYTNYSTKKKYFEFDFSKMRPLEQCSDSVTNNYFEVFFDKDMKVIQVKRYSDSYDNYTFCFENYNNYSIGSANWHFNDNSHTKSREVNGRFLIDLNHNHCYFLGFGVYKWKDSLDVRVKSIESVMQLDSSLEVINSAVFSELDEDFGKFKYKRHYKSISNYIETKIEIPEYLNYHSPIKYLLDKMIISPIELNNCDTIEYKRNLFLLPAWNRESHFIDGLNEFNK